MGAQGRLLQGLTCRVSDLRDRHGPRRSRGGVHAPGDGYAQARRCFEIIETALLELGVDRGSIVRTRLFVTEIQRWAESGRAHAEFFRAHPPTTTMVEVSRLIDPEMLIEVEADGVVVGK